MSFDEGKDDLVFDFADADDAMDTVLAKHVADILQAHYPNHLWAITADRESGVLTIRNFLLHPNMGMVLPFRTLSTDAGPFVKQIVMAGGEFLERFGLSRDALSIDQIMNVKTDIRGAALYES